MAIMAIICILNMSYIDPGDDGLQPSTRVRQPGL